MRIEEYKQRVVPETGKRDVPYAVREADFSAGLSIDPGKRLAEGAVKFGGAVVDAAGKISETLKKIQDEKDYLFTTGLTDELKTQLDTFQITEDSQSDAEKVEAMRKRMMMRIDSDRSISDAARANLTESVERKLQIFGAGLEFRRGEMVHKRNVKESYDRMGTAIQNGDFDAAMTHRAYLEKHLLPVPDAEEVRSKCILNRTVRSMEGAEYLVLYGQELELEEAIRAGTGLNGMNLGDTIAAKKKLKQRQAELSREMDEDFRKRFTDGKLEYANVKAAYDQGSVPVEVFNVWQRKFRELKSAEIMAEAEEAVIALKTKSMDRLEVKEKFETLGKDIDEALKTGELSREQANELKNGLKKQDFAAIRNAQEWAKKAQEDAKAKELLELAQADIPSDLREKEIMKKQMFEAFRKKFPDNWQAQRDYLNALDKRFKEDNVFNTPEGKLCRDVAAKAYKNGQLYYDPRGLLNKEKSPEFQAARYVELLKWQENELRKGTPVETIVKGTNERIADLNDAKIKNFLSVNLGGIRPNQSNGTSGKQAETSGTSGKTKEVSLKEGKRGTYQEKPVIIKGGKVVEDKPPRYSLKFMNDLAESDLLKGRNNDK